MSIRLMTAKRKFTKGAIHLRSLILMEIVETLTTAQQSAMGEQDLLSKDLEHVSAKTLSL